MCGNVVCGEHSQQRKMLPHIDKRTAQRVCDSCISLPAATAEAVRRQEGERETTGAGEAVEATGQAASAGSETCDSSDSEESEASASDGQAVENVTSAQSTAPSVLVSVDDSDGFTSPALSSPPAPAPPPKPPRVRGAAAVAEVSGTAQSMPSDATGENSLSSLPQAPPRKPPKATKSQQNVFSTSTDPPVPVNVEARARSLSGVSDVPESFVQMRQSVASGEFAAVGDGDFLGMVASTLSSMRLQNEVDDGGKYYSSSEEDDSDSNN
jgi:hypothetical protein